MHTSNTPELTALHKPWKINILNCSLKWW